MPTGLDTYEIAVLKWLREQPEPRTAAEIHQHFSSLTYPILLKVLDSLLAQDRVEQGTRGLMRTWRARWHG